MAAPIGVNECSMCLEQFDGSNPGFVLHTTAEQIDHVFHAACVNPWREQHHDCPLCREVVDNQQPLPSAPPLVPEQQYKYVQDDPELAPLPVRDGPVDRVPGHLLMDGMRDNVRFATLAMGESLSQSTAAYLTNNDIHFVEEANHMNPALWAAHLLKLPYTITVLAIRTACDALLAVLLIILDIVSAHSVEGIKQELKGRIYNLLVADTLSWLALPASLFHPSALTGANSLHLGTLRVIAAD